jgi:hypothetical protein
MRTGSAGTATLRHVGLVALEALLVALLAWIAAMTLAGAGQSNGLVGSVQAGRDPVSVTVRPAAFGQTSVVSVGGPPEDAWVHLTCAQNQQVVFSSWTRLDQHGRAKVRLGPTASWTSGGAACAAEVGWFSSNGRWRVEAVTPFSVTG